MTKKGKNVNPNRAEVKAGAAKKENKTVNNAMIFFLAGCVAELYLLIVRRFYVEGNVYRMLAWYDALRYVLFGGLALALIGLVLTVVWRKPAGTKRTIAEWMLAAGAFLALSGWMMRAIFPSGTTILCIVVPAATLLGVLWSLYEREDAITLSILGLSVLVLWICRKGIGNVNWNTKVLIGACVYLVLLAAGAFTAFRLDKNAGRLLGRKVMPADTDYLMVYVSCGLSAAAVVLALFSTTVAYYAAWGIALIIFGLAVYDTVKQL